MSTPIALTPPPRRADPDRSTALRLPLAAPSFLGRDTAAVRMRVERMEHLLEGLVRIPGLNRRLGLDVILDVLPVGGSAVAAAMGAWMVWEARNLGLSRWTIARMIGNVLFDMLLGAIPWVGALPDFFFRSNTRNLRIIRRRIDRLEESGPHARS